MAKRDYAAYKRKYLKYLKSSEWQKKRQDAFRIHGRKCKKCPSIRNIEINHRHYRTVFNEDPATDLEVLCHYCHRLHHGRAFGQRTRSTRKAAQKMRNRLGALERFRNQGYAMTMDDYREHGNRYLRSRHTRYHRCP
jgi:5-methylcytosine-specific restriction endonuclease McrA